MSREIKLRAWNKINKELTSDPIIDGENGKMMAFSMLDAQFVRHYRDDEVEIMQYTGLKDKNGKEIFNGDIVERKGIKYQITLEIGSFLLVKIDENTDMYEEFVDCWNDHVYPLSQLYWNNSDEENHIYDLEVIGNIYENPELLEATV